MGRSAGKRPMTNRQVLNVTTAVVSALSAPWLAWRHPDTYLLIYYLYELPWPSNRVGGKQVGFGGWWPCLLYFVPISCWVESALQSAAR